MRLAVAVTPSNYVKLKPKVLPHLLSIIELVFPEAQPSTHTGEIGQIRKKEVVSSVLPLYPIAIYLFLDLFRGFPEGSLGSLESIPLALHLRQHWPSNCQLPHLHSHWVLGPFEVFLPAPEHDRSTSLWYFFCSSLDFLSNSNLLALSEWDLPPLPECFGPLGVT